MKLFIPLFLSVLVSACAPILSHQEAHTALDSPGLEQGSIEWPTPTWWLRYRDPQLNELIEHALKDHPSIQLAQARLRQAQAALKGARAVQLPQVDANYSLTRQRFSENYIYPPPYAGSMLTDNNLQLQLGFDLDLWGRNRSLYASALSRQDSVQADWHAARNTLISAVVQSYFHWQNAQAQHDTLSKLSTHYEQILNLTTQRKANGLDTELEVQQAKGALAAARVQQKQAAHNAELLSHQLAQLSAQSPQATAHLQAHLPDIEVKPLPEFIPLDLLGRRPDILAAKKALEASQSQVQAAKAEFYPNINLSAFAGFLSLGLDSLLKDSSHVYGVGPAISLPIFHGGALNAQLDSRRAEQDMAIAQYRQRVLDGIQEVADAISSIRNLQNIQHEQEQAYQASSQALEIAVERYKSGLGNYIQVLLAQNDLMTQTQQKVDLQIQAFNRDAQLATVLGGGFDANEKQ